MQIFKRVKKKQAQNLVEFIFVFPLLLMITLVIFETALFWQDVNSIYNLNAEINANVALADTRNMTGPTDDGMGNVTPGQTCTAATNALATLEKRDSMISSTNPTYTKEIAKVSGVSQGVEPFALYKYTSSTTVANKPQTVLWVDCRSPFEKGITTQVEFYHKTVIIGATIPNFGGGDNIVVIPNNVFIASPKLNTLRHY